MSSQRRHDSVRATKSDQTKAKANRSKEQENKKDEPSERVEDTCAPQLERGTKKQKSKKEKDPHDCEDRRHEIPAPKRGTITEPSKKQKDLPNRERHANNTCENDRQDGAKSKRESKRQTDSFESQSEDKAQQTVKSKTGEKTAPKRQSKKQKDPSKLDREESLENSQSISEKKNETIPERRHKRATKTEFSGAGNAQDESPAVSARASDHKQKRAGKTATRALSVDDTLGKLFKDTLEKLKIKRLERSNASSCVNNITDEVIKYLKQNTNWCADIESLRTGSYYENLKICKPDEFDVMLTIPVERVDIQTLSEAGAFYSVGLKRLKKHSLDVFLNENKIIMASEMLRQFRDAVKKALEKSPYNIKIQRKKARCPAVTLEVEEKGRNISIDFVLGLKVHRASWPHYTKDGFKIENWLGTKEKAAMKQKPFYLVPKYEGKGSAEHDGLVAKDAWRISFSHVEKEILKRHGHSKTCCETGGQKCCRRECLKLLKYLLHQLKEDDSKSEKMSNFCSYHAKTTLLHACASRVNDSEWAYSQLANCFLELLRDFVMHLRNQNLSNFFIPSHNLLYQVPQSNCDFLAQEIELQLNNNFPIFS